MDIATPTQDPASVLPPALRAALFAGDDELPEEIERQIVALGEAVVPELVALVGDVSLSRAAGPDGGFVPIRAAELLGEIGSPNAAAPLVRALLPLGAHEVLHSAICLALTRFGAALVEPALAALAAAPPADARDGLCNALAGAGVKDDRIFDLLTERFAEDATLGAMALGLYGDARALPLLAQGLTELQPGPEPQLTRATLIELVAAYRDLAGSLPPELEARAASLREVVDAALVSGEHDPAAKNARNAIFVRRLEGAPGAPWLCADLCPLPDCDCRDATLFVASDRASLEPIVALLAAGEASSTLREQERADPTPGVVTATLQLDTGDLTPNTQAVVRRISVDGSAPVALPELHTLVDGALLDDLNDHWCRLKGLDPSASAVVESFRWERGESLPHGEVFINERMDLYGEDEHLYELVDQYCPIPDCDCDEVVLQWLELGSSVRELAAVSHTLGAALPDADAGDGVLARLWARLRLRYPEAPERFAARQRQVKDFGAALLALQEARRPTAKWVPTAKKRRQGKARR